MNVLAIGAHPDDVEEYCSGTLAKFAAHGHKVFTATTTNGNIGSATLPMEEIARIRKEEARQAAAVIGAEYLCLDYDDEMFFETREARIALINLVRYCKPDLILTHYPHDYNPDHELTSKMVNDIAVMIPIAKIETPNPPCEKIPLLAYWEPVLSINFNPTEYVDITDYMELKREMCNKHQSQVQWMADNYKEQIGDKQKNYFDDIEIIARFRGLQCGCDYAEGFIMAQNAYRMTTKRVLP